MLISRSQCLTVISIGSIFFTCAGEVGPKGDQGPQGESGEKGIMGPKGDTGVKGDKGDKAEKGEKGLMGRDGDKGDKGLRGRKGPPGPKGNIGGKQVNSHAHYSHSSILPLPPSAKPPVSHSQSLSFCYSVLSFFLLFYHCLLLSFPPLRPSPFFSFSSYFFQQMDIYATYDDLINSCTESLTPPTPGCMAFVLDTSFIYVLLPGDDCDWVPWVSGEGKLRLYMYVLYAHLRMYIGVRWEEEKKEKLFQVLI